MELDKRSRELISLIDAERDADTLIKYVHELNDRLQDHHRARALGMESPRNVTLKD